MNKFKTEITREELQQLAVYHFDKNIHLIESYKQLKNIIDQINHAKVLGFDTETKPSFTKGKINQVALLQLATNIDAFLIRINKIGLPEEITAILENTQIIKVGVAIRDDLKQLQKVRNFKPENFIELQSYVKQFGIQSNSIKKISGIVLNIRISKNQQLTDWEAPELTEKQQKYAATDAWACYQIYEKLNQTIQ